MKQDISISIVVNKQIPSCHIILNKTFVFFFEHIKGFKRYMWKKNYFIETFRITHNIFHVWDENQNIFWFIFHGLRVQST